MNTLTDRILKSLQAPPLRAETVILACGSLSQELRSEKYLPLLTAIGLSPERAREELAIAADALLPSRLNARLALELGAQMHEFVPEGEAARIRQELRPAGVILHIGAGNADGLPAFSVIEGLITGNFNILKLPSDDNGLSELILHRLCELEPILKDYIFLSHASSADIPAITELAAHADVISVWGGDEAVSSIRRIAPPDTRIVEWGRRISFAYVSGDAEEESLRGIAENICRTEQTLCSSCQGIYLDTESEDELDRFAVRFLELLSEVSLCIPSDTEASIIAQKTLELYADELEGTRLLRNPDRTCSVAVYADSLLAPSRMFRNCWVRPLPRKNIIPALKGYKNRLQTAALLCPPDDAAFLSEALIRAGVLRITDGYGMSRSYCGMPHDGIFPLRSYVKIISFG